MPDEALVTVLVVDDEIDIRVLVRLVLDSASEGIHVVADAVDGVDALTQFNHYDPPTIVILDNQMPGMSGLEVAKEMRRRVPLQHIILFAAFITPEVVAEANEVGIDACVGKNDFWRLPDLVMELAGLHRRG